MRRDRGALAARAQVCPLALRIAGRKSLNVTTQHSLFMGILLCTIQAPR